MSPLQPRFAKPCLLALSLVVGCGDGGPTPAEPDAGAPVPTVTAVAPDQVPAGSEATTLRVLGRDFRPASVVRWDGGDRPTTFVGDGELAAVIPAQDLVAARIATVTVFTPHPGGGESREGRAVSVTNPTPTLTGLSPSRAMAPSQAFVLTVTGERFVPASVVRWSGQDRPTTFAGPTQLRASIPATDLAAAGEVAVTVVNPAPGGGVSAPQVFRLTPAPTFRFEGRTYTVEKVLARLEESFGQPGLRVYLTTDASAGCAELRRTLPGAQAHYPGPGAGPFGAPVEVALWMSGTSVSERRSPPFPGAITRFDPDARTVEGWIRADDLGDRGDRVDAEFVGVLCG